MIAPFAVECARAAWHDQHHRVRRGGNREQEIGGRGPFFLAAGEMGLCPLFHETDAAYHLIVTTQTNIILGANKNEGDDNGAGTIG